MNANPNANASTATPLIEVRNLKKYFGKPERPVRAVDDVSFTIRQGETLGLVGESGSGKSTIGRTVLRLIERSAGEVRYRGDDLGALDSERMRRLRSKLQIIFQDPYASLNPKMRISSILGEALEKRVGGESAAMVTTLLASADPAEFEAESVTV